MKAPPLAPVKIMLIGGSATEGLDSSTSYRRYPCKQNRRGTFDRWHHQKHRPGDHSAALEKRKSENRDRAKPSGHRQRRNVRPAQPAGKRGHQDAFFQTVVYNVKGTALHNKKVLYAQKSHAYGKQRRASAACYAALAQQAENGIHALIRHYNRELVTVGAKWDHMASLPGPAGDQWRQWDMPPLSTYSGEGEPRMKLTAEGGKADVMPGFSVYERDQRFIDLYNTGTGSVTWTASTSADWIRLNESSGVIYDEARIWVSIDWEKVPKGRAIEGRGRAGRPVCGGHCCRAGESALVDER
jgi:hypothetical protein